MPPTELERKDYRYCPTCDEVFHVRRIKTREGLFKGDVTGEVCPDGHKVEPLAAATA